MKRVVFIGSSQWGLKALETLGELDEIKVIGAITNPSVFKISYRPQGVRNVNYADVAAYCGGHGIPAYTMAADESMKSQRLTEQIAHWRPDAFFVLGWYHIVPRSIREVAPVLGIHYSLLPDYAGGAPLVWALINGEREVGATLFRFDGGVDTGPVLGQVRVSVKPRETIASLYPRVGEASLGLIRTALPAWVRGDRVFVAQDETGRRRFAQRAPSDGLIDWTCSAASIDRWIRAQTRPYPGAFSWVNGVQLHIWSAQPTGPTTLAPGLLNAHGVVGCGDGQGLQLTEAELDGVVLEGPALVEAFTPGTRLDSSGPQASHNGV